MTYLVIRKVYTFRLSYTEFPTGTIISTITVGLLIVYLLVQYRYQYVCEIAKNANPLGIRDPCQPEMYGENSMNRSILAVPHNNGLELIGLL